MARKRISIDTDAIKRMEAQLSNSKNVLIDNMLEAADDVLMDTEGTAQSLAPRDSGHLERTILSSNAKHMAGKISGSVGSNSVYALRRHEEAPRRGTYHKYEDGVRYDNYYFNGRGERTRAKPKVAGFQAGRKYLSNAAELNRDNWRNELSDAVSRTYGGKA